ncbi:phosphatases II [Anaeromyces robustus]|uniref:Phosphatases II n=1 Tax=Anaeromyces robustus TaxID=1754192 RepID=A0A1Y1WQ86_9FUNG|nr:phosphatases II [Anaeromyces robustus]|eukprot:ORX75693.1 phosphatases II [Anaeromyces robustus]
MAYLRSPKSELQIKKNSEILPILTLPPITKHSITEKCSSPTKIYSNYGSNTIMKISSKKLYKRNSYGNPKQASPTIAIRTRTNPRQSNPTFTIRTSLTHPLNISWITPIENLILTSNCSLEKRINDFRIGRLALSSCPGKKVRLHTGPVNGRAAISRDLDLDFKRLKSFNISAIVCCLNDAELSYLGAPWKLYSEKAKLYGLEIFRLPIIEGSCPESIVEVDRLMEKMVNTAKEGKNILCHCRGGIGRAGLIACCYLLKCGYTKKYSDAIKIVRAQRSPQAIETRKQEDFIAHYSSWVKNEDHFF